MLNETANLFFLCSNVSSLGTDQEREVHRSSVTILYTIDRETSGNSNERVVIVNPLFLRIFISKACNKSSVITEDWSRVFFIIGF
ncbi:hypothetical protein TNCV_1044631 [Trichonephila clavipes]|nr:hypothetical protein TNCV_1044631 [Trichonephila clavipes]